MIRGIDTDNYDGTVSVQRFRNLYDNHGVRFNIVSMERGGPFADGQKANAEEAGMIVPACYRFLYWDNQDLERMREACRMGLPVWIDCEWAQGMAGGPAATVERIATARDLLKGEGLYAGIYSGRWWWQPFTNDTQVFAGDHGWGANYPFGNNLPPMDYPPDFQRLIHFGGLDFKVWQYANTCYDEPGFDMNAALEPFWEDDVEENYEGEINEHRAQVVLIEAVMTGKVRVAFTDTGLALARDDGSADVSLPLPIPEWGKPT